MSLLKEIEKLKEQGIDYLAVDIDQRDNNINLTMGRSDRLHKVRINYTLFNQAKEDPELEDRITKELKMRLIFGD